MTSVRAVAGPAAGLDRLPGVEAAWSRQLTVADASGVPRRWHLLDNGAEPSTGTLLCVHGNPTWSYLWRRFLSAAPAGWRVLAVDQLGMGWSERTEKPRGLAERISDLGTVTDALGVHGPVVTVAHDWGGPVSLGWAEAHVDQLAGVVLFNTGVDLPRGAGLPGLIRLARSAALREIACVRTPLFVRTAAALSRPALPPDVRRALALPYGDPAARRAVGDFVADIPLEADHPTRPRLEAVAEGLSRLGQIPVLIGWGPRDPVFTERHLADLLRRLPHADVHRYPGASHLVTEDAPRSADDVWHWIADHVADHPSPTANSPSGLAATGTNLRAHRLPASSRPRPRLGPVCCRGPPSSAAATIPRWRWSN